MWKTLDIQTLWPEQSVKWPDNFSDQDKQGVMLILKECVQSLLPKWVDFNETANSDWEWATLSRSSSTSQDLLRTLTSMLDMQLVRSCELRADGGLLKIKIRLNPQELAILKAPFGSFLPELQKEAADLPQSSTLSMTNILSAREDNPALE